MLLKSIGICVLGVTLIGSASNADAVPCAVIGDSIAVGIAAQLPACRRNAKIGIPSTAVVSRVDKSAAVTVVSAGSNDPLNPKLTENLKRIRNRAKRVVWVLPVNPKARAAVKAVAAAYGDPTVSFAPAGDHVHPQSYAALANAVSSAAALR
jgi:hypothetical protein